MNAKPTVVRAHRLHGTDLYYAYHRGETLLIKLDQHAPSAVAAGDDDCVVASDRGARRGRVSSCISEYERALAVKMCLEGSPLRVVRQKLPDLTPGAWRSIKLQAGVCV